MSNSTPPKLGDEKFPVRPLVCSCQHCNQQIEFDAGGVKGNEIIALDCPYCKKETTATVPLTEREIEQIRVAEAEAAVERLTHQKICTIKDALRARLQSGKPVFLFESVFLPVDSKLLDKVFAKEFDISILRQLGLLGWDVVSAVPKTMGIGLENVGTQTTIFGSMWAGGVGGNVMGVYVILRKSLSFADVTNDVSDEAGNFIRTHLDDFKSL